MLTFATPAGAYLTFVTLVLGLCMGSFLNCLAWRMTHGESVLRGRSHCASCGHVLAAPDLVPVVSWLALRGECRYCGERVSVRYPAAELVCGIVYVSLLWRYGLSLETVELMAFSCVLLVLSLTDLDEYIIPNSTIAAALLIRLIYAVSLSLTGAGDGVVFVRDALIGGFAVAVPVLLLALVMDRVLGRDSLGGGDVKVLFVAGAYFGMAQSLFLLIVACVIGIALGYVLGKRDRLIPFGPAIAAACWVCMLCGDAVVGWYLSLAFGM